MPVVVRFIKSHKTPQDPKRGQTVVEYILLMAVVVGISFMVRNFVIGGEGSIGYQVLSYFESQVDSQATSPQGKATLGGKGSWNHYYVEPEQVRRSQVRVQ